MRFVFSLSRFHNHISFNRTTYDLTFSLLFTVISIMNRKDVFTYQILFNVYVYIFSLARLFFFHFAIQWSVTINFALHFHLRESVRFEWTNRAGGKTPPVRAQWYEKWKIFNLQGHRDAIWLSPSMCLVVQWVDFLLKASHLNLQQLDVDDLSFYQSNWSKWNPSHLPLFTFFFCNENFSSSLKEKPRKVWVRVVFLSSSFVHL